MIKLKNSRGFTLIEIMVSLVILLIVSMMTSSALNFIAQSKVHLTEQVKIFSQIQIAITVIENDLRQIKPMDKLTSTYPTQPILVLSDSYLQLTRSDFFDPKLNTKKNSLQIVTYQLIGENLVRFSRRNQNNVFAKKLNYQIILNGVKKFEYKIIPLNNPLTNPANPKLKNKKITTGIIIAITTRQFGQIKRVIILPINTMDTDPNAVISIF